MGRPKRKPPNHGKYFEVKKTVGHKMDGTPIRKSFYSEKSRDDAARRGEDWIIAHKVAEQAGDVFVGKEYTFAQWARKWLEVYKKPNVDPNTYKLSYKNTVEKYLIPAFGAAKMDSIKPIDVQQFFDRHMNLSESVLKKLHMCMWSIFDTGIDNDVCRKNPVKRIKAKSKRRKNVKRVYTEEQIEKVKALAEKSIVPEVYLILNTGMRREEVLGLRWEDFSEKNKSISVNRALADVQDKSRTDVENLVAPRIKENPPKRNSYRVIPISDECVAFLAALPHNGPYIFPKANGNPQSPNTWSHKMKLFMVEMHAKDPSIPQFFLRMNSATPMLRIFAGKRQMFIQSQKSWAIKTLIWTQIFILRTSWSLCEKV